ncbi:MAG: hypothetical protein HKN13_02780, partial [Rhodothermales bacterium]|nr:hypothetical protein [Rhodothermales bacterium]
AQAIAAILRDALIEGHHMAIPGLGTLRVTHEPSRVEVRPDGSEEMIPPRDVVTFEPED